MLPITNDVRTLAIWTSAPGIFPGPVFHMTQGHD